VTERKGNARAVGLENPQEHQMLIAERQCNLPLQGGKLPATLQVFPTNNNWSSVVPRLSGCTTLAHLVLLQVRKRNVVQTTRPSSSGLPILPSAFVPGALQLRGIEESLHVALYILS